MKSAKTAVTGGSTYYRNRWFPALLRRELRPGKMSVVSVNDDLTVILYLTDTGKIVCAEDRCPHQSQPLSYGSLQGNNVQCAYHGWKFDPAGELIEIPHLSARVALPSKKGCLTTFPAKDRFGIVWIFLGETAPDEAQDEEYGLANFDSVSRGVNHFSPKNVYKYSWPCSPTVCIDNIVDLAHIFLHQRTIRHFFWTEYEFADIEVHEQSESEFRMTYLMNFRKDGADVPGELAVKVSPLGYLRVHARSPSLPIFGELDLDYTLVFGGYANGDTTWFLHGVLLPLGDVPTRLMRLTNRVYARGLGLTVAEDIPSNKVKRDIFAQDRVRIVKTGTYLDKGLIEFRKWADERSIP